MIVARRPSFRCCSLSSLTLATWEKAEQATSVLNLAIGQPAPSLLPTEELQRSASRLPKYDPRHLLQYGAAAGSRHYLDATATFLSEHLGYEIPPRNLFATPGNSGGLALLARKLSRPGDSVLMEEPSYFLAHQLFRDYSLHLIPMPQLPGGLGTIDLDALTPSRVGKWPSLLYCVPTGNNPTGRSMPDDDRARLVSLCAAHGVVLIADDVYEMLQWEVGPRPLRWHARDLGVSDVVVSLGSWSKILGPGLRLGWIEADEATRTTLAADGEVDSGSLTAPLTESLVTEMLGSGDVGVHLLRLRAALSRRASLLSAAINSEQPAGMPTIVNPAPAGYFLWVELPAGVDANALRDWCVIHHGVDFLPGPRCGLAPKSEPPSRSWLAHRARVCFAFLEEEELVEAGRRLGRAIAEAAAGGGAQFMPMPSQILG